MADLGYPNQEAFDEIGVFDKFDEGHEPGWAQTTIDRMTKKFFVRSDWSAEELKLYDFYQEEVLTTEGWDRLVKAYKATVVEEKTGGDGNVDYVNYDPKTEYIDKPALTFDGPENIREYSDGSGNTGDLVVTPEAIEYLCGQLDLFVPAEDTGLIWQTIRKLDKIEIKPGTFGKAVALANKVTGMDGSNSDGGLKGDTRALLVDIHEALFDLKVNLRAMTKEYTNAEELNTLTGEKFKDIMSETWSGINKFSQHGNTDTNAQGEEREGSGDDSSDSKDSKDSKDSSDNA